MKKIIISLLFAMGMVTSSYAISLEGLSVGLSIGEAGFYGVGEEKTDNQKSGVDHTKEAGAFRDNVGSVFIEYSVGGIGFGLDYKPHTIETPENKNFQAGGTGTGDDADATNRVSAEFEIHATAYVIISNPAQGALDGLLDGLYLKAGAIHGCAIIDKNNPIIYMEDVGRHNAIDKIAGYMFLKKIRGTNKTFYTTGRLTSEMVIKTVKMNIPILISRSGFTSWGVELAKKTNLTLIGRAKGKKYLVLSGEKRIDYK